MLEILILLMVDPPSHEPTMMSSRLSNCLIMVNDGFVSHYCNHDLLTWVLEKGHFMTEKDSRIAMGSPTIKWYWP